MIKCIRIKLTKEHRKRIIKPDYLENNFIVLTDRRVSEKGVVFTDSYIWNIIDLSADAYEMCKDGDYSMMHKDLGFSNTDGQKRHFEDIDKKIKSAPVFQVTDLIGNKKVTQYMRVITPDLGVIILSYKSGLKHPTYLNGGDTPSCGRGAELWYYEDKFGTLLYDTHNPYQNGPVTSQGKTCTTTKKSI